MSEAVIVKNKKVLIIEDERSMAQALKLKLAQVGFESEVVFNGEDGVKILQEKSYDLILLDIVMPRLDGFAVLETLKSMKISTPIVIVSNLSREGDEKRVKDLGAKDYIIKSNTPIAKIIDRVKKFLK